MIVRKGMQAALGLTLALGAGTALGADYIVKLKSDTDTVHAMAQTTFAGHKIQDHHAAGRLVKISLDTKGRSQVAVAKLLADLMKRPDVAYVTEDFKLKLFGTPNDPRFGEQWALAKVRAAEAWDKSPGSRKAVVAVIDTGVDYSHPDLVANGWLNPAEIAGNGVDDDGNGLVDDVHGWDFLDNDAEPLDVTSSDNPGHGTHCSGIVGAVGGNGIGTSGMSQQVSIMALRFIGPDGQGDLMAAIKSIDYAILANADVISASWGAQVAASQAAPLIEAIGRASDAGVTFVSAAANDGANNDSTEMYPANADFPNLIAVAASDTTDAKPTWSNFGKAKVSLAAPGADILSTLPGNTYGALSGTSMATPLVAGLVALVKARAAEQGLANPSGAEVRSLLQMTGAKVAIETACMCRVDAAAAVQALDAKTLLVVPAAATYAAGTEARISALGGAGGYKFVSANPAVVEVSEAGDLVAKTEGETTIKVTDASGATADSLIFRVAGQGTPGGGEECPLGDPTICALVCLFDPTLPWCTTP